MSQLIVSEPALHQFIGKHPITAVYYSGPDCNVCQVLKPKLFDMLQQQFPRIPIGEVDCSESAELSAQQVVFSIPTLIVYFEGKEAIRKTRSFSLTELASDLERPYSILFQD